DGRRPASPHNAGAGRGTANGRDGRRRVRRLAQESTGRSPRPPTPLDRRAPGGSHRPRVLVRAGEELYPGVGRGRREPSARLQVIDIGLIGCGRVVHENYAPTLVGRTEYRVRYVFDRDERQALSAAAIFGAESVSLERLLATADAVVVATPPSTHVELVERCLEQRVKIILCEKPFAPSFAAAADLVRRAEERGVGLYVGHLRRSFPHLRLARSLVSLGSIGAPRAFVASEGGRFRWESVSDYTGSSETGGVLWDTGSHTLDTALFVAGLDEPQVEGVKVVCVDRDQPEPSHHFSGD